MKRVIAPDKVCTGRLLLVTSLISKQPQTSAEVALDATGVL
jgi:hypothetical protein